MVGDKEMERQREKEERKQGGGGERWVRKRKTEGERAQ